jgi:N-acetylmuramoyl-L-alanine amidase
MKYYNIKSPNFQKKVRKMTEIRFIIIHYTGMQSKRVSLARLIDKKSKVSCHYLIDRKGKVIKMVDDNKVAWHAGKSKWKKYVNREKLRT